MTEVGEKQEVIQELRKAILPVFTDDPNFPIYLKEMLDRTMREIVFEECPDYGDAFARRGLPTLVVHCDRKASRLYNMLILGYPGNHDFEHELFDLLRFTVYTATYFYMVQKKKAELERSS